MKLVDAKDDILYTRATVNPLEEVDDLEQQEKDMIALMHKKLGIGLAANQVGLNQRMFVMSHSEMGDIGVYNPEILDKGEPVQMEEGCLTFPMLYLHVRRPKEVNVRYQNRHGDVVTGWLKGMDARVFQHEFQHLEGKVFIDDVSELKLKRAKEKRDKLLKKMSRRR